MTRTEHYQCVVRRDNDGRITTIEIDARDLEGHRRSVRIEGDRADQTAALLYEVLQQAGIRARQWSSAAPIALDAALGAHAELLLRAVKPLRRSDRIISIAEGVAGMSREEAGYWHAQAQRRRGLKALRILLNGEVRR